MEELTNWWERFKTWVRYEPVRAAEAVRAFLFALTGVLAVFGPGAEDILTQISGLVTAGFSLYATQFTRGKVSPTAKIEDEAAKQDLNGV